jgi:hypothetical protein
MIKSRKRAREHCIFKSICGYSEDELQIVDSRWPGGWGPVGHVGEGLRDVGRGCAG